MRTFSQIISKFCILLKFMNFIDFDFEQFYLISFFCSVLEQIVHDWMLQAAFCFASVNLFTMHLLVFLLADYNNSCMHEEVLMGGRSMHLLGQCIPHEHFFMHVHDWMLQAAFCFASVNLFTMHLLVFLLADYNNSCMHEEVLMGGRSKFSMVKVREEEVLIQ